MSAVVPPPPPSGSILQKQSSFSRSKAGSTVAAASASANQTPATANKPPVKNSPQPNAYQTDPAANSVARPGMQDQNMAIPKAAQNREAPVSPMAHAQSQPTGGAPVKQPQQPLSSAMMEKRPMEPMGQPGQPTPPPGMWGPNGQIEPAKGAHPPTISPSSGVKRSVPPPGGANGISATPISTPAAAVGAKRYVGGAQMPPGNTPSTANSNNGGAGGPGVGAGNVAPPAGSPLMARKNSMNGSMGSGYGSMGPGGPMAGYGSMGAGGPMVRYGSMGPGGPMGGYGSMGGGGPMAGYGSLGPGGVNGTGMSSMYGANNPSSMYGQVNIGSMIGALGGSMYGQSRGGADDVAAGAGSMYGQNPGAGSMMGGMGSMYGMGSLFGSMMGPMGSMYGMAGPIGSMYGAGGGNMSAYGIAAQWGSLANMSAAGRGGAQNRSGISSEYGGFASEAAAVDLNDLCPNIGTFEDAKDLKRSGRRGGNHLYSRDKHEKIVATNNSNAQALTIKRKGDVKASPGAGATGSSANTAETSARNTSRSTPGAAAGSSNNIAGSKARAKVPSNYNVHSLIIVDKARGPVVTTVKDPSTVVYEKAGKKETFEVDEAIERVSNKEEVDSVLLSELRTNWFNGHNSSLMMCCGKGKNTATREVARNFIQKCIERLEKNEKDTGVKFDITMSMVSLRGADQCCDLLKSNASYDKMAMGSSPVYGPCLLDLETKVVKTGAEATEHFNAGIKNAKEEKEIVTVFYVLKTIKKSGAEVEVHLSSMCLALCGETVSHMTDIKDKLSSSPHRLFRYAVDGACVTVSGLCIDSNDEEAQAALEVERKMREVKNQPPRSGNVKRFVDFTYKEITRQKEKVATATGSEKKTRETQIERMEEMVKDANELLSEPEKTRPKGYSTGR